MKLRVGVIGSGGFGRAIALASARNKHDVLLWSRREREMPDGIVATTKLADIRDREIIFVAVPSNHVEDLAAQLASHLDGSHLVVHVSRGLVGPELKPITTVLRERTACRRLGALAGPLVADALAEGRPSGGIVGTGFPEVTEMVRHAIGGSALRLYETKDVIGVQFASATVGLLTVLLGYAQEIGSDPGTLAVVATRGIVEMSRIGEAFDAKRETFMGLAGLGDLIAAVAGDERPEYRVGQALAQGLDISKAIGEAGAYVEGVDVGKNLISHANRLGIDLPISSFFASTLDGKMSPDEAIRGLMERRVGKE